MAHNTLISRGYAGTVLRGTDRAIARLQAKTQIDLARIGQAAVLQISRVETVACVGRRAMFETALLTQVEGSLGALVPMAVSRLQAIGDLATLGIAEVVGDTVRQVTR